MNKEEILEAISDEYEDSCPTTGCKACQYYQLLNPTKLATYLAELETRMEKIHSNCDSQP